ncbi:hypothetical protein BBJ28_00011206 [Nothophytophthora sp. Chile5]|nr:hypothetical protein BBJ28_00011206 [Nothophytophthora sp. Chile5]
MAEAVADYDDDSSTESETYEFEDAFAVDDADGNRLHFPVTPVESSAEPQSLAPSPDAPLPNCINILDLQAVFEAASTPQNEAPAVNSSVDEAPDLGVQRDVVPIAQRAVPEQLHIPEPPSLPVTPQYTAPRTRNTERRDAGTVRATSAKPRGPKTPVVVDMTDEKATDHYVIPRRKIPCVDCTQPMPGKNALKKARFSHSGTESDAADDADDDLEQQQQQHSLGERQPLLSSRSSGDNGALTAAALSPSIGQSSALLRRNFQGSHGKRKSTDVLALGCLATYWIGMIALALTAFSHESNVSFAEYIKSGVDFQGHSCGTHRFVYFPDVRANPDFGFCVDQCPAKDGELLKVQLPLQSSKSKTDGSAQLHEVEFKSYATHRWAYCWQVFIITSGVSLGSAALYLILLRYCGCITVLLSTGGIQATLTYSSYRLLMAAADPLSYANDPVMLSSLQVGAVAMCCAAILFLLFAVVMMSRLLLAGAFITHASCALSQLKRLLVVPFISYVLLLLLFGWGILVTVCLFGAGETSTRVATISANSPSSIQVETEAFQVSTKLRWLVLYHAWGMYWSVNFLLSIGEMITATAVSLWYFSPENRVTGLKDFEEPDPVSYSAQTTAKYHLGTLALSSGIVGPVEYIRSFFLYLENKNEFDANPFTEFAAKCCCYCLKYICKEAFYITAIQGTTFYSSGKQIPSPVLPLVVIVLFSYSVAHAFMTVGILRECDCRGIYETSINMLLMCFTLDENMHGGRGNAAHASAPLIRSVNDHLRPKWQTDL